MGKSKPVADVVASYPPRAQARHAELTRLLEGEAARLGVGPLTETLKWGEPAYLTEASKAGTTVRLAWSEKAPDVFQVLVHCQTTLVEEWRRTFDGALDFDGNRSIRLPLDGPLPKDELAQCFAAALSYHRR